MRNISKRSLSLAFFDWIAVLCAFTLAFYIRTGGQWTQAIQYPFLYLSLIVFTVIFYVFDLYYPFRRFFPTETAVDVLLSVFTGIVITSAIAYADRSFIMPRSIFLYTTVLLMVFILFIRFFYDALFHSKFLDKKVLVLGTGPIADEIIRTIRATPHSGMEVVGVVREKNKPAVSKIKIPIVGTMNDLISLIDFYDIKLVVLALDPKEDFSELKALSMLLESRVSVTSAIHLFEKLEGEVPYQQLGTHYLLGLTSQIKARPYLRVKRVIDLFFSFLLFIILSPILILCMILLSFSGPAKIFFLQERIGKGGNRFRLLKFRSMTMNKKGKTVITPLGQWMRRYRIDEIPQLINVLKGDMSLIGPRPEIPYFVERCRKRIPFYDAVFAVKPGLTGWAQVKFRYTTSVKDYEQKFRYNLYYLKNFSLSLDLLIILKTIRVVVLGKGK
jgi:exopolysaccharide biosynthesis polyprenyl glycosylphosphotransferase